MLQPDAKPSSLIDVHQLRLRDACALLEHGHVAQLPGLDAAPLEHLQGVIDGLCELSLKDPLTGLANRRHFRTVLEREIDVVARSGESALLLMLDIDHFKKINDTHGHTAGDTVLQSVARCLNSCVRPKDTVARYGGEEFAVVLPNCQQTVGRVVAERIRETIEALARQQARGRPLRDFGAEYRCYPSGSHLVFYRQAGSNIEVVRILHASMDIIRHL